MDISKQLNHFLLLNSFIKIWEYIYIYIFPDAHMMIIENKFSFEDLKIKW